MNSIKKSNIGIAIAVFFLALLVMWTYLGYSSGYGQVVDGGVVYIRKPLVYHMMQDYKRDGGEWSFGYFVPFAVAGLFWFRRKQLLQTSAEPSYWIGGLILLASFVIYWAGHRGEQKYFGYVAGQLFVLGALFWFLGWKWFKNVFWLWALLGMMWPWRLLIDFVSQPLQMIMVRLTSAFMDLIGVPAAASGSALSTATLDPVTAKPISLDIHVECSGMRSLFALVMIGLVFSFLRVNTEWKRWVLMLFVPVVAVAGNFVRMLMLYFGSVWKGTEFAIGDGLEGHAMSHFHLFSGLMVFVVALALMTLIAAILEGGVKKVFSRSKVVSRRVVQTREVTE